MENKKGVSTIEELEFVPRDMDIFRIPDLRTRIDTVQKYFFPRLEVLVRHSMNIARELFTLDPYESCIFTYHPYPRKETKNLYDCTKACLGITGKRRIDRELRFLRPGLKPLSFYPNFLYFEIDTQGTIRVVLELFRLTSSRETALQIAALFERNSTFITRLLVGAQLSHTGVFEADYLASAIRAWAEHLNEFIVYSPRYYFPVSRNRGLADLTTSFITLYPLFEALHQCGEGSEPTLLPSLWKVREWLQNQAEESDLHKPSRENFEPELPELESYKFVRPRVWWDVLARDKWTCLSCGRQGKDGVTLEVDHILPRSKGGADMIENLQTLCKKCNIGKSNRDSTDLR